MINSRVMITMQRQRAIRATEIPLGKRHVYNSSASAASLAASSGLGIFKELSTACYSFVGQHIHKHAPRSIRYTFGEMMILNHSFDVKVFTGNYTILQGKASAQFMQPVSTNVADFEILSSEFKPCLSSVIGTFDFSADLPLQSFKFVLRFNKEARISYGLSVGEGSKVLQANINSNFAFRIWMNSTVVRQFTRENSKPLASFVLLDGESFDFSFGYSVEYDWQVANFADLNMLIVDKLKAGLGVSDAHNSGLVARKAFFFGVFFDTPEEVLESLVNTVRNVLQNLAMNFRRIPFGYGVIIKFCQRNFPKLVGILRNGKKIVISRFANLKVVDNTHFLLGRRIDSVFEHLLNDHSVWVYQPIYKLFGGNKAIHPTAKAVSFLA